MTTSNGSTATCGPDATWVRLNGDIDIARTPELDETVRHLSTTPSRNVHVDLVDVTFAGTSLLTFFVRLHAATATHAPLCVHHPTPMIRKIINLAALDSIVDLPSDHPR